MTAVVLDGLGRAQRLVEATAARVRTLALTPPPTLAIVVGATAVARRNLGIKRRLASEAGVRLRLVDVPAGATTASVLARVAGLGADDEVDGLFLQFPLPPPVDADVVAGAMPGGRDVDGSGPAAAFPPAAVAAAMAALDDAGALAAGRRAVLLGPADGRDDRGPVPGFLAALARCLGDAGLAVERFRIDDEPRRAAALGADVVVTAIGEPGRVGGADVAPGAVVVDAGVSRVDGRVVGDVDRASVGETAGLLVPMPGGLGPLTVAALLDHVVTAAERRRGPAT